MPVHIKIPEQNRLVYYAELPDGGFWEQHWRTHFNPAVYERAENGNLGYFEAPFTEHLPQSGKILEAGCGLGQVVLALRARGYDCEGIESDAGTVALVHSYRPDIPLREGDVASLDVADGYYAAYISLGVVEHYHKGPETILREAHRALVPGGVAYISVPHFHLLRRCKARLGCYRGNPDGLSFYQYAFSMQDMKAVLLSCDFSVVEVHPYDVWKGLKDEISVLRCLRKMPYLGVRIEQRIRTLTFLGRQFSHMIGFVVQKAGSRKDPTTRCRQTGA